MYRRRSFTDTAGCCLRAAEDDVAAARFSAPGMRTRRRAASARCPRCAGSPSPLTCRWQWLCPGRIDRHYSRTGFESRRYQFAPGRARAMGSSRPMPAQPRRSALLANVAVSSGSSIGATHRAVALWRSEGLCWTCRSAPTRSARGCGHVINMRAVDVRSSSKRSGPEATALIFASVVAAALNTSSTRCSQRRNDVANRRAHPVRPAAPRAHLSAASSCSSSSPMKANGGGALWRARAVPGRLRHDSA